MPAPQDRERGRRRPEYGYARAGRSGTPEIARYLVRLFRCIPAHDQGSQPAIGRPVARAPLRGFLGHEIRQIAMDERLHNGMLRREGL